jgi:hypothetical protein
LLDHLSSSEDYWLKIDRAAGINSKDFSKFSRLAHFYASFSPGQLCHVSSADADYQQVVFQNNLQSHSLDEYDLISIDSSLYFSSIRFSSSRSFFLRRIS